MLRSNDTLNANETVDTLAALTYYPAYMHKAHPLSQDWVKLPASLIKRLHVPKGWEASHPDIGCTEAAPVNSATGFPLFHYLNHPLSYIQLCGIVVDINYKDNLGAWTIQLDDSSGELIDVLVKKYVDPNAPKQQKSNSDSVGQDSFLGQGDIIPAYTISWIGCSWIEGKIFDVRTIEVGLILRVKGRLSPWSRGRQLLLEKFDIFRSTSQEITFWNQMTDDFKLVLSKPWIIGIQKQEELRLEFEKMKIRREKRARHLELQARKAMKEKKKKKKKKKMEGQTSGYKRRNGNIQDSPDFTDQPLQDIAICDGKLSDPSPIVNGLAPSYQVPPIAGNSSGNSKKTETNECANAPSDSGQQIVHIQRSVEIKEKDLRANASSTVEPARDEPIAEMIDMGSPSQWNELSFETSSVYPMILTGSEWSEARNNTSVQRNTPIPSKDKQKKMPQLLPSVMQEWNELEL